MQLPSRYKAALVFTLIEPGFELLFLLLHNFVFYHLANLQFAGVSIGALLAFFGKFQLPNMYLEQYLVMLPIAACLGIFILVRQLFGSPLLLRYLLLAAAYIYLLLGVILLISQYNILHILSWQMLSSALLSGLYWFSSVSLSWVVLAKTRLL